MLKLKLQYIGHLMRRVDSLEKTDARRDWGQEEKGMTADEMAGWHHRLDGHEVEWTPGVGNGQGGLVCCHSWGRKESDTTEWLNWTELMQYWSLQHWTLLLSSVTSTTGYCFCFGSIPSFFLKLFLHWSPVAYWAPGEFLFQYPIILPFHSVDGILKARILKWFAILFSSGPHSVHIHTHKYI